MARLRQSIILALYVLVAGRAAKGTSSPPIKVALRSSWPAHNLLLEFLETAALEEPASFFPLVDILTDSDAFPKPLASLTPEAIHEAALKLALGDGWLSETDVLASFELALSLHSASPKLEAFYQYYREQKLHDKPTSSSVLEQDCGSWVDWYGKRLCGREELASVAIPVAIESSQQPLLPQNTPQPKILPFDHILPDPSTITETPPHTAILYADITSANFRELHTELLRHATAQPPRLEYIFRHVPKRTEDSATAPREYLSGYGVGLDLKKTDYLVLDDRLARRSDDSTDEETSLQEEDSILNFILSKASVESIGDISTPLTKEELSNLGIQVIKLVKESSNPFQTLQEILQDFPRLAVPIARGIQLSDAEIAAARDEVDENSQKVPPGTNMIWMNGLVLRELDFGPFTILNLLRNERRIIQSITSAGLSPGQAMDVLSSKHIYASMSQSAVLDGVFDASDRSEGGEVIIWLNNVEQDERYKSWSPSLKKLMAPIHTSHFPYVKRNLYNVVMAVDLSNRHTLIWIFQHVSNLINRKFPFRWGLVPLVDTPGAAEAARIFYYVYKHYGPEETMDFVRSLIAAQEEGDSLDFLITNAFFNNLAINVLPLHEGKVLDPEVSHDYDIVRAGTEQHSIDQLEKTQQWAARMDVSILDEPLGVVFVNGKWFRLDKNFLPHLQNEASVQGQFMRDEYLKGVLRDELLDVSNFFYDLSTTPKRRNRYLYPSPEPGSLRIHNLPDLFEKTGVFFDDKFFLYPSEESPEDTIKSTIWIVADIDTPAGVELVKEAIKGLDQTGSYRLAIVHAPRDVPSEDVVRQQRHSTIIHELYPVLDTTSPSDLLTILEEPIIEQVVSVSSDGDDLDKQVLWSPTVQALLDHALTELGGASLKIDWNLYRRRAESSRLLAREIGLAPGEAGIIINGRVLGPIHAGGFLSGDFGSLVAYELHKRGSAVVLSLNDIGFESTTFNRKIYADIVTKVSSVVSAVNIPDPLQEGLFQQGARPRQRGYKMLASEHTTAIYGDSATALFHFAFLLDPLSETAQKWSPLISWLSTLEGSYIEVHFHTATSREEMPLKRFYRSSLQDKLTFGEDGKEVSNWVQFDNLPVEPIYTLSMDVPQSWLVRPRDSVYDLDNIHLANVPSSGVSAIFDLDFLVIEGHARDTTNGNPPRGLQLQLTEGSGSERVTIADTQVVENLGYFQFKAKPGVFQLEIREGRGTEVFLMDSVGNLGWNSPPVSDAGAEVTLTSFAGLTLYPCFTRQIGQLDAEVLRPRRKGVIPGLFEKVKNSVTTLFSGSAGKKEADINIFTVASGHLYERFASIMILSVMKNTNSTVKFWFIENFLSPAFLEFVPYLAQEYKFDYELVTYKWPWWLRAQREKQRVIWGYKILFLDVLFPMDLKKVVFVDADQIVRADLKELVDLDLQGAPYGYTPMGDDNEDMEGFRFWKTGYWAEFLRGKPYHISALYVIDLVRFRQIAAGDRLRGQYQGLSADPNSLANLDQDLPNNLQHEIPIFSLDKDWLWCETWCSKDRFDSAKTIDLCQNPLTKEPKLARARQIPEWSAYDAEIATLAKRLAKDGKIQASALSEEVDELATVGKGAKKDAQGSVDEIPQVAVGVVPSSDPAKQQVEVVPEPEPEVQHEEL